MTALLAGLAVAAIVLGAAGWWLLRGRAEGAPQPVPEMPLHWRDLLAERLPLADRLAPELRARFERNLGEFMGRVQWYGCGGHEIQEAQCVLIAATACLLILRPQAPVYPRLRSVLLYPARFLVPDMGPGKDGVPDDDGVIDVVDASGVETWGESHDTGRVILNWEDVEAALDGDPVNVTVHEFAHQLDEADAGAPQLTDYTRWSDVMQREYRALERRRSPVLDDYGLEGPGEFFAVASEAYFQQGAALRAHHRGLYELLRDFYLVETAG